MPFPEIEKKQGQEELNTISDRYYALQNAQEDLVRGNLTETKKLLAELQAAQDNLRQKEDIMRRARTFHGPQEDFP
ncbi:MAG: hypothetical protein IPI69_16260 [Bacteroidales bacterium]|nr:hypothetical protein [Bacteroidales bacterium]